MTEVVVDIEAVIGQFEKYDDEIRRLREALREISTRNFPEGTATLELRKIARAALGEGK